MYVKEEPKQTVEEYNEQGLEKYSNELEEISLEEAADKCAKRSSSAVFQELHAEDFIAGAKWQRMYSEEEVKNILMKTDRFLRADLDKWFEQLKEIDVMGHDYYGQSMKDFLNKINSYSEQDMAEAFIACWKANVPDGIECKVSFNEWFENFKKK